MVSNKECTKRTIAEAGKVWLKRCKLEGLERATIRSYESHLRIHIEPKIGEMLLDELTASKVRDFIDQVIEEKSSAMSKKVLGSLRAIISEVQERGWIDRNVARDVKLRNSKRHKPDRVIPTKDQIRLLLDTVSSRNKPLLTTAIFTGMRISELRGLVWDCVDFSAGVIHVKQRADRYNVIGKPKSKAGTRKIPMTPLVGDLLREWKNNCPIGQLNLVFPNGAGNVETLSNIYNRIFKPLMNQCEIVDINGKPKFSIHSLRHAAASLMIDQRWEPKRIQSIMGHSSITMTYDVYGHLFYDPEGDIEAMAKLESDLLAA